MRELAADLAAPPLPGSFIDFETISFAVPTWSGTRPYQMIAFQLSVHRLDQDGALEHANFLDLTGNDPSRAFAEALAGACLRHGPISVHDASFEKTRITEVAIHARVVDLHPIARNRYYDPDQHGSWSIKCVLPAIAPELRYDQIDGVQDGAMRWVPILKPSTPRRSRGAGARSMCSCGSAGAADPGVQGKPERADDG